MTKRRWCDGGDGECKRESGRTRATRRAARREEEESLRTRSAWARLAQDARDSTFRGERPRVPVVNSERCGVRAVEEQGTG